MSPIMPDQPTELVTTKRLTPERLAEIKNLLRYESSISFQSARAKESMLLLVAEVETLQAELEPYEMLAAQQCENGKHADWAVDSEHNHRCPWCRIATLEAALTAADPNTQGGAR